MKSVLTLALAAATPAAAMLACDHIVADGVRFDFGALRGPHSVVTTQHTPPTDQNTTYTLDLCGPLKRRGDVPKGEECPNGSWACAIRRWRAGDGSTGIGQVIPLAGQLENQGGRPLDASYALLAKEGDHDREGLRITLRGGRYPLDGPAADRQDQRVVVEMVCDPDRDGTEGEWRDDAYDPNGGPANSTTATTEAGEKQLTTDTEPALVFGGYEVHDDGGQTGTLRLTWHTKHACERAADARTHWGFFTWFVILVFLGTATYLIFGSWLNYNRYGARGWDLVPHGDTLRDVPYLLQDWVRVVVNTLQGSGSRGGYSAV